ncbi:MAG: 6-phosphogluconolactonase [Chloroflexota bacterium]|nr:6-phosphogluconolactonase [Chloroflexota bacterium]
MSRRFVVLATPEAVAEAAADRIVAAARNAIRRRRRFRIALSGGSTPRPVYALLAAPPRVAAVEWSRVEFFWGDERCVPPDDAESNFGMGTRLLLDRLPGLKEGAVHRMPADAPDREAAARRYQAEVARAFGIAPDAPHPPAFDLVWLGMGRDGHTASLFPGSTALTDRHRWVVATWAPAPAVWRMTLTLPVINAARSVLFVVSGGDKAGPLRSIRSGALDLPAARVRARSTVWLVDATAAGIDRA